MEIDQPASSSPTQKLLFECQFLHEVKVIHILLLFFWRTKLLAEAIGAKDTFRSQNTVKKFKIPKNKPKKPELYNPSTTKKSTVAILSIHSSIASELNFTNTSTASTPATSIHFDVEISSRAVKPRADSISESER